MVKMKEGRRLKVIAKKVSSLEEKDFERVYVYFSPPSHTIALS